MLDPRTLLRTACCLALASAAAFAQSAPPPLPNPEQLRQRALTNMARTAAERERYLCRELFTSRQLDSKGAVKKTEVVERESFYVHGREIFQTLARDGKPLSADELRKQSERVRKDIEEATKATPGKRQPGLISTGDFVRLSRLTHERRVLVAGRPTVVFDAAGDPTQPAASIPDRIMQAMAGTISIDEATGNPQDIDLHGQRDVKVGGGLVADIHKGFAFHAVVAPQPDGVWMIVRVDGTGDARVGLFTHPSVSFTQQTESCKLTSVSADAIVKSAP